MDGIDIANVVIPDAEFKFFMTASSEKRAERRYKELLEKGENVTLEKVLEDIENRDKNDSTRAISPLKKSEDAMLLDTSDMTVSDVVDFILKEVKEK